MRRGKWSRKRAAAALAIALFLTGCTMGEDPLSSLVTHQLTVSTDGNGTVSNAWDVWAFPDEPAKPPSRKLQIGGPDALRQRYPGATAPSPAPRPSECDLLVTPRLDAGSLAYAADGGRVLLLDPETAFPVEKTNYRLSSWDGGGPSGTTIDRGHPALRGVPSDGWCDLQFYPLIQGSKTVALDALPVRVEPLVRCIDRPTRLANRAYLFEVSVGKGRLLVCGFNMAQAAERKDPAALFLLDQLVLYALGPSAGPPALLPVEDLQARVKK
jgi:hypothetical protein